MIRLGTNRFGGRVFAFALIVSLLAGGDASVIAQMDKTKYISVDEVTTDMEAYCLTVVSGTEIERFPLKIISTVKGFKPGRDAILVVGTDEVFKKVGAVQGCSGSPVYIDGRMAGALSAGYSFAKDPIYIITPIEDMLDIPNWADPVESAGKSGSQKLSLDYNCPIDLSAAYDQVQKSLDTIAENSQLQMRPMALTTSLPQNICDQLSNVFKPLGFVPVAGPVGLVADDNAGPIDYAPGGVLALPLVSGDISMNAIGTVTEVVGDEVYGFGHSFQGYGEVNFPMATGKIHMIIPSVQMSFKLGQSNQITGTLTHDQSAGIIGKIGQKPKLISLKVTVKTFTDVEPQTYNCNIAYNRLLSPSLIQSVVLGASQVKGSLPPEHTIKYKVRLNVQGCETLTFEDVTSGDGYREILSGAIGMASLFMNNPFREVRINSLDVEMDITADNSRAALSSIELSETKVKAGQVIDIAMRLNTYQNLKKTQTAKFKIPADTPPGKYSLFVSGGSEYERLVKKLAAHKFTADSISGLVKAIKNVAEIKHNRIYITLQLPAKGITVEGKELPNLPSTKTMLLTDKKRTADIKPLNRWHNITVDTEDVIVGGREFKIIVEK